MTIILNKEFSKSEFHREAYRYHVYKVEKRINEIILHYFYEYYMSTWIQDETTFKAFPGKYAVQAGGWYSDYGQWDTLKRIVRKIRCSGVSKLSEESTNATEATVSLVKSIGVEFVKVHVASADAGSLRFVCTEVADTGYYKLLLFDKIQNDFVDSTHLFDGEFTFTGTLQPQSNSDLDASDLANKQVTFLGENYNKMRDLFETICPLCDGDDFIGCLLPNPENCPYGKAT